MFGTFKSAFLAISCLVQVCVANQYAALTLNTAIHPGDSIVSPDGRVKLQLENTKLALYKDNRDIFDFNANSQTKMLVLTAVGNLELHLANGQVIWESYTPYMGVTSFNVTNDGYASLYQGPYYAGWSFWVPAVSSNQYVTRNMPIVSPDFRRFLVLTSNQLLVAQSNGAASKIVVSAPQGTYMNRLTLAIDGNLMIHDTTGRLFWTSNTVNLGGINLIVTNSGYAQLLTASKKVVWQV